MKSTLALALVLGCAATTTDRSAASRFKSAHLDLPLAEKRLVLARAEPAGAEAKPEPVLRFMQKELERSMEELTRKGAPPPYFISYEAHDLHDVTWAAEYGGIVRSSDTQKRVADVSVRVGDHALDNTHRLRGGENYSFAFSMGTPLPMDDDEQAIRSVLWIQTDKQYKRATEDLIKIKAEKQVKAEEEDQSDDFSKEKPSRYLESPAKLSLSGAWEDRLRDYSALFKAHPEILSSSVALNAEASTRYLVTSEGSLLQTSRVRYRVAVWAATKADDGMMLTRHESLEGDTEAAIEDDARIRETIQLVIDDLMALRDAPVADPYQGPAIIEGKAAGVFFHEIFGHRMEGQRQKEEDSSQTFAKKLGKQVMPTFINVYDDPGVRSLNGITLNGFYRYDNEGIPAQKASLVEKGVVKTFLMSRMPTRGIDRSNGHGRRQPGQSVVARQANLIVDPEKTTTPEDLKKALIAEVRRQGKPFGLRFGSIQGGFTFTNRFLPQAFKVLPTMVYRVYPDGREVLVRGLNLEGTPLTALSKILAAANDFDVFNGQCGAESGLVPVSGTSPSLLVEQIEVARKEKSQERPPLLEPPQPTAVVEGGAS